MIKFRHEWRISMELFIHRSGALEPLRVVDAHDFAVSSRGILNVDKLIETPNGLEPYPVLIVPAGEWTRVSAHYRVITDGGDGDDAAPGAEGRGGA